AIAHRRTRSQRHLPRDSDDGDVPAVSRRCTAGAACRRGTRTSRAQCCARVTATISGPMGVFRRTVFVLLLAACATTPTPPLGRLYTEYQNAIEARDAAAAKRYVSAGRARNLSETSDDDALASMNVLSPKSDLAVVSETVAGDEATLIVRATV